MKNITRSFTTTTATVKCYNEETDSIVTVSASLVGKFDADSFKKEYSKVQSMIVLKVTDCVSLDELYGMTEEAFIAYGMAYNERSKNTRGMISKTVSTNSYIVKLWNNDNDEIVERVFTAPSIKALEKNLPTNYKLLKVVSESKVESLICMDVNTFKELAHPMIDHFHYKA